MKRFSLALLAAVPLVLGLSSIAQADASGGFQSGFPTGGVVAVTGTVVSTDSANGTFVANAVVLAPPWYHHGWGQGDDNGQGSDSDQSNGLPFGLGGLPFGGSGFNLNGFLSGGLSGFLNDFGLGSTLGGSNPGQEPVVSSPTPQQVTISTGQDTMLVVNGQQGSVSDMSAGDKFLALFSGSPSDSLSTIVANPALAVFDHSAPKPRQLYAFVGTVTGVDTTNGTVSVSVSNSLPSSLVPAGSPPVTLTVGPDTLVLGGSGGNGLSGGSLNGVSQGDVVAAALVAPAGETLAQVESTPLKLLLDLPAAVVPTTTSSARKRAESKALSEALVLLGYSHKSKSKPKHHGKKPGKGHKGHKGHKK